MKKALMQIHDYSLLGSREIANISLNISELPEIKWYTSAHNLLPSSSVTLMI